jgi:8-oxo-dGTP diphosphatase
MRPAYGAKENGIGQHPATIIVDVANVMGSRPDGWWRDRAGAAVRLHADIAALAARSTALAASGRPILPDEPDPPCFVMVLEGAARAAAARIDADDGRVRVVQADGSGDDAIVALARELPGRRFVVTADRELQRRCVAAGAAILRPGWLLGLVREPLSGRPARSTGRPHSPSRPRRARRRSEHRSRQ